LRKTALAEYEDFSILGKCPECNGQLVDAGGDEEKVCSSCGIVFGRADGVQYSSAPPANGNESLGSFIMRGDSALRGSAFCQARLRPNVIGRDGVVLSCSKLLERISDRMMLPKGVIENAVITARRLLPGRKAYGATVPAISAYALLYACRSAGITHIGYREIVSAYSDAGHRVSNADLLRIGIGSSLSLPHSNLEDLVRAAVRKLQANVEVIERLKEAKLNAHAYFARLFELAKEIAARSSTIGGLNPRTVATGSVYLANLSIGPKMVRQREAAETLGMAEYTIREFCIRARKQMEAR
jgi:transcription initiation factor TFIIIB Brf1 subunit/transcription initiation factor TFIIB